MSFTRLLCLIVGPSVLAVALYLLLSHGPTAIAFACLAAASLPLTAMGFVKGRTPFRRLLVASVWIAFSGAALATLAWLYLLQADSLSRAIAVTCLLVGALGSMRATFVATRRTRNSLRDYYG